MLLSVELEIVAKQTSRSIAKKGWPSSARRRLHHYLPTSGFNQLIRFPLTSKTFSLRIYKLFELIALAEPMKLQVDVPVPDLLLQD